MVWCTSRLFFTVLASLVLHTQGRHVVSSKDIPVNSFSCTGRPTGYYADTETGCQVYHLCDGGGRQFSYSCPNTTLFHQRMLICAHWYQVNCSRSESDYDANLLIGQRDKPFVSETEHRYFTYRKRLPNYGVGVQRSSPRESGLAGDGADGRGTTVSVTRSKPETGATRQGNDEGITQPVSTSTIATTNSVDTTQQVSDEVTNSLLNDKWFALPAATVVNDRSAPSGPTENDYANVKGKEADSNIDLQTTAGSGNVQGVDTFADRFVPQENVYSIPHRANGHKQVLEKNVYMNDFKTKGTSLELPSLYLQPPRYNSRPIVENNKIELVFEDPRRIFYIGENSSEWVNAEPMLVTIHLNKGQMLFRNQHSCDKCHPLFIVNKDTCKPCVIVR